METLIAQIFATQMPIMDGMYFLTLASRVLHLASAIILVGGIAYLCKVVVPGINRDEADIGKQLFSGRRKAWAKWTGISTLLLLVTGFFNFIQIVKANPDLPSAYHAVFGIKFLLAMAVFFLAAILAGKTSGADRFRQRAKMWLTVCLALGMTVVVLASFLRSLHLPGTPSDSAVEPANQPSTSQSE